MFDLLLSHRLRGNMTLRALGLGLVVSAPMVVFACERLERRARNCALLMQLSRLR